MWLVWFARITQQGVPVEQTRGEKREREAYKEHVNYQTLLEMVTSIVENLTLIAAFFNFFDQEKVIVSMRRKRMNVL